MSRAFFSLYLLIVFSVVGVGWGVDKLWLVFNPDVETNVYVKSLVTTLEHSLRKVPAEKRQAIATSLLGDSALKVSLFDFDEFADSGLGNDILSGDIVTIISDKGDQKSYKRIEGTSNILCITFSQEKGFKGYISEALLLVFYLAIALVIYFWVWPLSKDLRQLELQTQQVGKDGVPDKIRLGSRSAIFRLANSFNKMSDRIRELISSHKEMTYAVSHELRTPLARMKFALEMAADTDVLDEKRLRKQLDSLREDVSEMNSLVNELLAFAGFEQGEHSLDQKPGDINALILNVLKTASSYRVEYPQTVDDFLDGIPVYCEWYLMERALRNVVQNAHRYAESRICVTLESDGLNYIVSIEDDGPGIAEQDRERVFQSFVRLRMNTNFDKSGFGLGLAIVARIMKWHNGSAKVEVSRWGGAKFVLRWPLPNVLQPF